MIDRLTVDKIIDAARIVDVVGEFVTLRKSGVNYKGLCPFHDDKHPSFMVSPAKNICHCFVCGKGGTPVSFLMEHEQMSYADALRWLARKYHIEIQEKEMTDEERQAYSDRESMFVVNDWARQYFHNLLSNDLDGRTIGLQYFRSRGIRDDIIEKFQLGYASPNRNALWSEALKKGFQEKFLVQTGLVYKRESDGSLADRYAGRVIFPWFNISGKVVAFGGRLLDARTKGVAQKYVNSPDSDLYHKERELYGLYQAKRAIVKEDRVFMVEGYTDVIAMHQAGVENVVANSGTALSHYQIAALRRFSQNITLLYDGDEAGIHAAMRGTDMLLSDGMNVRVLLLPDGDDPDSFARKHSSEELRKYIEEHQTDFITFKSRLTVETITDPVKRSEGIAGIVKSIAVIPDQILRSTYLSEFAHRIGMKEQPLIAEMNKYIRAGVNAAPAPSATLQAPTSSPTPAPVGVPRVEELLMSEIVRHGDEIIFANVRTADGGTTSLNVAQYVSLDLGSDHLEFAIEQHRKMLQEAVEHSTEAGFKAESYFCNHPDMAISQEATTLALDRHPLSGRFVVEQREDSLVQRVTHLVMDFRLNHLDNELKDIQQQMRNPENTTEQTLQLLRLHQDRKTMRDMLAKKLGASLS